MNHHPQIDERLNLNKGSLNFHNENDDALLAQALNDLENESDNIYSKPQGKSYRKNKRSERSANKNKSNMEKEIASLKDKKQKDILTNRRKLLCSLSISSSDGGTKDGCEIRVDFFTNIIFFATYTHFFINNSLFQPKLGIA